MLFAELEKIVNKINGMDAKKAMPKFRDEMARRNAAIVDQIKGQDTDPKVSNLILDSVVMGTISLAIKTIPKFVNIMAAVVKKKHKRPDIRCAVAGALAYLVQPRDLIPDDAPGGYGYLDDAVILHMAASEYLRLNPSRVAEAKDELNIAKLAGSLCPPEVVPRLQAMVEGATYGFSIMGQLPANILDGVTNQIIANPFLANAYDQYAGNVNPAPSGYTSELEKRNLLGMSLISEGGSISMTFPDGSGIAMSG